MYAPGIVGLVFALVVLLFMKDTPENFGHAPVSTPKPKQKETTAVGEQFASCSLPSLSPLYFHK